MTAHATLMYAELTLKNQALPTESIDRVKIAPGELETRVDRNAGVFLLTMNAVDYRRAFVPPLRFTPASTTTDDAKIVRGALHFQILTSADNLPKPVAGADATSHVVRHLGVELVPSPRNGEGTPFVGRGYPVHVLSADEFTFVPARGSKFLDLKVSAEATRRLQDDLATFPRGFRPMINLHVLTEEGITRAVFRLDEETADVWLQRRLYPPNRAEISPPTDRARSLGRRIRGLKESLLIRLQAKRLVKIKDISWLPKPNTAEWFRSKRLPTNAPLTGAYVIAIRDQKILIARHRRRGWDIPGGHVDPGETPEETAVFETLEETGARIGAPELFAFQRLNLTGAKPENYKYPYPLSYQALYLADIEDLGEFAEEEDMIERALEPCEVALARIDWTKNAPGLVEAVVRAVNQRSTK